MNGQRIIIFGGTRGLGLAAALAFASEGASVLVASRDSGAVAAAVALIGERCTGKPPLGQRCDVSSAADIAAAVSRATRHWGGLDAVVNCAGVLGPLGPLNDIDWDAWRQAVEVNLFGTALVSRAVIPVFKAAGRGKLVHLSGGGATRALEGMSAYCASKAGLVRLVEVLADELRGTHVDVNAVAPGPLDTRMTDQVLAAGPRMVGDDYYATVTGFKESGGTPLDIPVSLIRFLLSPASDGISGRLVSALWDPWRDSAAFQCALENPDMFRLRRVDR